MPSPSKLPRLLFISAGACLLLASDLSRVPESLRPPADERLLLHAKGSGDQIYLCTEASGNFGWKLKAPDARLTGAKGESIGRHFAGPTWEANDGSRVVAKTSATAASPDGKSIPWLLLSAVSHSGTGAMTRVESIQRLETKGGQAPGTGCDATHSGSERRVPYQAEYFFFGTPTR